MTDTLTRDLYIWNLQLSDKAFFEEIASHGLEGLSNYRDIFQAEYAYDILQQTDQKKSDITDICNALHIKRNLLVLWMSPLRPMIDEATETIETSLFVKEHFKEPKHLEDFNENKETFKKYILTRDKDAPKYINNDFVLKIIWILYLKDIANQLITKSRGEHINEYSTDCVHLCEDFDCIKNHPQWKCNKKIGPCEDYISFKPTETTIKPKQSRLFEEAKQ